jgi:hypothetical protein
VHREGARRGGHDDPAAARRSLGRASAPGRAGRGAHEPSSARSPSGLRPRQQTTRRPSGKEEGWGT